MILSLGQDPGRERIEDVQLSLGKAIQLWEDLI